jgi:hypothetical protein
LLTRSADPLPKGCFAAMNGRSSMPAPGEGTRPAAIPATQSNPCLFAVAAIPGFTGFPQACT